VSVPRRVSSPSVWVGITAMHEDKDIVEIHCTATHAPKAETCQAYTREAIGRESLRPSREHTSSARSTPRIHHVQGSLHNALRYSLSCLYLPSPSSPCPSPISEVCPARLSKALYFNVLYRENTAAVPANRRLDLFLLQTIRGL
jgi:hypothetical protein